MTVKEAHESIEKLKALYDDLGRLQNLCLAKTESLRLPISFTKRFGFGTRKAASL